MFSHRKSFLSYLLLWLVLCCISAAPSFLMAYKEFNFYGMLTGVLIFVVFYALLNASAAYERLMQRFAFLRKAVFVGFGLRILLSVMPLLALIPGFRFFATAVIVLDGSSGLLALQVNRILFGRPELDKFHSEFFPTLLTTLVQGMLLSTMILLTTLGAWGCLVLHHRLRRS